jgi:hypothetical protein
MLQPPRVLLVSVADSVQLLRERYRAASLQAIANSSNRRPTPFRTSEPDLIMFMNVLVSEIVDNGTANYGLRPGVGPAAQLLMEAGMSREDAELTSVEVFRGVVDEIATYAPHAKFGENTGWDYAVGGDYDIYITMPSITRS